MHGPPGVGKSELAREFARLNHDSYSGGTFLIDASKDAIAINLATIGKNVLDINFPADLHVNDQGLQTFYTLSTAPVLLIYDNVEAFDRISSWLPLTGAPCHILITTLADQPNAAWPFIEVKPLSRPQSLELVEKLSGGVLSPQLSAAIVDHAGGLPVQIVPDATTLAYEQRRGRLKAANLTLARQSGDSFEAAYSRLEQPTRLLLHAAAFLNPQRILASELSQHFSEGLGWSEADFDRALADCLDLHLLEGAPDPSMHQLLASFLRSTPLSPDDKAALSKITPLQAKRFAQLAAELETNPADTKAAAALVSYPPSFEAWEAIGEPISVEQGIVVGNALSSIGRFDEARPWFERAVVEKEKGDVKGRIDHKGLGVSLHQVGYCLERTAGIMRRDLGSSALLRKKRMHTGS